MTGDLASHETGPAHRQEPSAGDRLRWLRRNSMRWLLALALLAVAVVVGVSWSLGLFSASSANPKNTVSAGSMSQVNSADDAAIMSAPDMVPGDVVEGTATIQNVGDASGDFTLTSKDVTGTPGPNGGSLVARLRLKVYNEQTNKRIYSGRIDGLDLSLGTWAPGESRSYRFDVEFPEGTDADDNRYQFSRVSATFQWHAVQSH